MSSCSYGTIMFSYLEKRELRYFLAQVVHLVVFHCHPQTVTFQLHVHTNMHVLVTLVPQKMTQVIKKLIILVNKQNWIVTV